MSNCTKTSNNKYTGCPPRMDDGRHFTDYRPHCHMASTIQADNGIHNSFQSRLFLTQNATKLIELNRKEACSKNCCGPCQAPYQLSTTMPEASAMVLGGPVPCGQKTSMEPIVLSALRARRSLDALTFNGMRLVDSPLKSSWSFSERLESSA